MTQGLDKTEHLDITDNAVPQADKLPENNKDTTVNINEEINKKLNIKYYAFDTLSEEDRIIYMQILNCMLNTESETTVELVGEDSISRLFSLCLEDHPEIFYVSGYQYTSILANGEIIQVVFRPTYSVEVEQISEYKEKIEQGVAQCMSGYTDTKDEYEKVKYFYDYIIENTEYDINASHNQDIYSVFVDKASVCQGYAKALQYLLQKSGVEAMIVNGKANGGNHVWNLVKVNGNYYYIDPTWGDASSVFSQGITPEDFVQPVNYDYFLVTTEEINKTHTIESMIDMPLCDTINDNFYYREGLFVDSYDKDVFKRIFNNMYDSNSRNVTIKCSNEYVYKAVRDKLINEQEVFDYLKFWDDDISYTENSKQLTISFWI